MKEIKIEHLAYLLKHAKENNEPQPIFFLGAGASRTGNIPLASEITSKISEDFSESPFFKDLKPELRTYAALMECLLPAQRDKLLKDYIKEAKINVTHIYLAQLLNEGYVDYILTVNFDNLMLRALALYNIFPPTYDMAILTDLTTTTFKEKSVVYLHGQNHGLWLLNTPEEMDKVRTIVPRIFDSIKNGRPWIFIGYSAEDPVFEHVKNLGRFDNGLYWVTYNDHLPSEKVLDFISGSNTNASLIKGYDSDSFMLKLNSELGLNQPRIVDKPFTALKEMLNEIVDIDDKDHFIGVKERLEISKRQVNKAIQQYELGNIEPSKEMKEDTEIDLIKKEIINLIVNNNFDKTTIDEIEKKAQNVQDENLHDLLSGLYSNWGSYIGDKAVLENNEVARELYQDAFKKYEKAIDYKNSNNDAYTNWGADLGNFAKITNPDKTEEFYYLAFQKLEQSIAIEPSSEAFINWGTHLGNFALTKERNEAEKLHRLAIEKFIKAIELKPSPEAYVNWGLDLEYLADINDKDAETLYQQATEKYKKAIELKHDHYKAYASWGVALGCLAQLNKEETYYIEAFKKFDKAIEIEPQNSRTYSNYGKFIVDLANEKSGVEAEVYYNKAFEILLKSDQYGGDCYNLACLYAFKNETKKAFEYLNKSLQRREVEVSYVEKDNDWENYWGTNEFVKILNNYRRS